MTVREGGWRNVEAWFAPGNSKSTHSRVKKFGLLTNAIHPRGRKDILDAYYDFPSILVHVFQSLVFNKEHVHVEINGIYTDVCHHLTLTCYATHASFTERKWSEELEINYLDVSYEDIAAALHEAVQDEAAAQEVLTHA